MLLLFLCIFLLCVISQQNESDVFQHLICKEFQELKRYIAEEEDHFLKLVSRKATELISNIEIQVKQKNEILCSVKEKERQLEILGNENHLHFIQVRLSTKLGPQYCR